MSFIETALPDTASWIRHLEQGELPVLARTAKALAELAKDIDDLAPRDIASVVGDDPLMTLKVLVWAGKHLARNMRATRNSLGNEIETVEAAIVSTGISPFFRQFAVVETIETRLASLPEARLGLIRVLARSLAAAEFARDWAGHRNDLEIHVIAEAAMLHDVAEMLVWARAPALALRMQTIARAHPNMRTREIQKAVLGITYNQLEVAIMAAWRLPSLLKRLTDDAHADSPQVKNVVLAANLARHLANSHDDPALPDDYIDIARLLRTTPESVRSRVLPTTHATPLPSLAA